MSRLSGQRAFVVQRLSALVLLAYLAAAALRLVAGPAPPLAQWQAWSAQPLAAAMLLVLVAALFLHAWVGIRDVILDYAPAAWRTLFLAGAALGLALLAARSAFLLLSHAL